MKAKAMLMSLLAMVLAGGLFLTGCSGGSSGSSSSATPSDDSPTSVSSLTYQGSTSPLTHLYFEHFGSYGGVYNIDLTLAPVAVAYGSDSPPDGRYVYLEMFFAASSVTSGTYTFSTSETAGTFSDFSDITIFSGGQESWHDMTGGTVTIAKSGSTYTINGNVTTTQGPATFSYVGPLSDER